MQIDRKVLEKIKSIPSPKIIGVSGFGGSGKSTFAKELGALLDAPVVAVDSFQKKGAFDTEYSNWEIMDFDRLEREVLAPFVKNEEVIRYGHFDAKTETIYDTREFKNEGVLLVEGVGLFRPELAKYFGYKIWVNVPIELSVARGKKRDRDEYQSPNDELWEGLWKDNDLQYLAAYKPNESADCIYENS
jgi:uridine kinase